MTHISVSTRLSELGKCFRGCIAIVLVLTGCTTTQKVKQKVTLGVPEEDLVLEQGSDNQANSNGWIYDFDDHGYINLPIREVEVPSSSPIDSLVLANTDDLTIEKKETIDEVPISPVAQKIVENYNNSENKEPNGHCLSVSKNRFEQAYREVHGHSVYQDLPKYMGTDEYTPKQVYNLLYVSASDTKKGWRSLPEEYRGKGNAGALVYAGMGTLVDTEGVWSGALRPGALMQVWRFEEDYKKVVKGADVKKLDPYGHSFVFIAYVRNEKNEIEGLKIADQGFQSYRPLVPRDYEVWWGVNLGI